MDKKSKLTTPAEQKKQCQLRFPIDVWNEIQSRCKEDGITYQKLGELMYDMYLKRNKEIMRVVDKYVEQKTGKGKSTNLSDLEKNELLKLIEAQHSPLAKLEKKIKEEGGDIIL